MITGDVIYSKLWLSVWQQSLWLHVHQFQVSSLKERHSHSRQQYTGDGGGVKTKKEASNVLRVLVYGQFVTWHDADWGNCNNGQGF